MFGIDTILMQRNCGWFRKSWNGITCIEDYRLPTLTIEIPPAVDGDGFRNHLLRNFGIEIGNGLGELSARFGV